MQQARPRSAASAKLYLLPIVILLAFSLPHLDQGDFRRDTGRYAAVGLQMWDSGSLLTPYLNPETPYFSKPPMAFWIHGLFLKLFGRHLAVARIPSICAAVGVLLFSMFAVRNLATRREAIVSGLVLATTYEFVRRTREVSLDFWQLFFVMLAVWLISVSIRRDRRSPVVASGIAIGLALLCKPLVALGVFPIFAVWLAIAGRARLIAWLGIAVAMAIVVALPWHLYMYATFGARFTRQYFLHEVIAHAIRPERSNSFGYYFVENLRTYWPWLLAIALAVYLRIKREPARARDGRHPPVPKARRLRRRSDLFSYGAIWTVVVLLALSSFSEKKPNYALPLYPMLAWIVAWGLCRLRLSPLRRWYDRGLPWLAPATLLVLAAASLAPIRVQRPPGLNWEAVLQWMATTRTDPAQLAYEDIDEKEVCYVFLKTGKWMKSVERARVDRRDPHQPLLIVTRYGGADLATRFDVVFSTGKIHIVRERL